VWRVLVFLNSLPVVLQEAWQFRTQVLFNPVALLLLDISMPRIFGPESSSIHLPHSWI
jgi:hypothetical protein